MEKKLYYGIGRRRITPEVPISLAGYFNIRMWETVADDIEVRALVLKQGRKYSAVVQFDLLTVSQELMEAFCGEIADQKVITRRNLIATATHSHTAPHVLSIRPGSHPGYVPFVAKKAAEALREAMDHMVPGELFTGLTRDDRFCLNRRYWMKDGVVVTNPGKLNPEISRPEGEVDYEIPLIGIKSEGQLKVLIANIVNHTDTIGNSNVSADWPGFLIRRLEGKLGTASMVMPLIGASGNINHFDVYSDRDQTSYGEAQIIGCGYAETIEKALPGLHAVGSFKLDTRSLEIVCGAREVPEDEISEARAIVEKFKDAPDPGVGANLTSEDLSRKTPVALKYFAKGLLAIADNKEPVKFNLVGIFLGKCCIVSLPSEPFVEIGLQIKKGIFHQYNTLVASHSNGTGNLRIGGGYIPNPWNYGRGGYETTPRSNPFSVRTADSLIAAWRKMAKTRD